MKKFLAISFVLFMILFSCSGGGMNSSKTPKEIGEKVMTLLNRMGNTSQAEFSDFFVTVGEIHDIASDEDLGFDSDQREIMASQTQEALESRHKFMRDRLLIGGRNLGIIWEDAEFEKFDFEEKVFVGGKFCFGTLVFKHRSKRFEVSTSSVWNGNAYLLTEVSNLQEVKDR